MIVDTSVMAAIVLGEPERDAFVDAITGSAVRKISAASVVELVELYVRRLTVAEPVRELLADLAKLNITIVGINNEQTFTAMDARVRYGKGRHPAGLNFGDCFSYALAKTMDEPLLYKGEDFAHTDVQAAALPQR